MFITTELATVSYIGATILFILSLGGLSNQATALRGNLYGIVGMTLAVLATVFGPSVTLAGIPWIIGAVLVGASIGLYAARTVKMTQMPELVALMHSMVGLAAMLVGFAAIADDVVLLFLGEQWLPTVPVLVALCIARTVTPICAINSRNSSATKKK